MKKIKFLLSMLLVALLMMASAGCYFVKGQKMSRVKGTYELTSYTRTNGKTNKVTDYINNGYQAYLVVTGEGQGYYIYINNDDEAIPYYQVVSMTYTYNQENSKLVDYVTYRYGSGEEVKLGVTKDSLNFSRPAIKLSENIASDGLSMTWKRVSGDTDLSYAQIKLGALTEYSPNTNE